MVPNSERGTVNSKHEPETEHELKKSEARSVNDRLSCSIQLSGISQLEQRPRVEVRDLSAVV
ncbi:MAG TPA: hypothetical protein VFO67_12810, partial [Gemmatimonadales bacterium]|nr:hypothetical protein [Gemmatimonadales bacterium]